MAVYWAETYLYYGLPGDSWKVAGEAIGSRDGTMLTFTPLSFSTIVASIHKYCKESGIGNDWAQHVTSVYGTWSNQTMNCWIRWFPSNGVWPAGSGYAACKTWINANYAGTAGDSGWKNVRTANQTILMRASWGTVNANYYTVKSYWNEVVHYADIIPPPVNAMGWQWLISCFPLLTILALGGATNYWGAIARYQRFARMQGSVLPQRMVMNGQSTDGRLVQVQRQDEHEGGGRRLWTGWRDGPLHNRSRLHRPVLLLELPAGPGLGHSVRCLPRLAPAGAQAG